MKEKRSILMINKATIWFFEQVDKRDKTPEGLI